jgi:hypothetical protein
MLDSMWTAPRGPPASHGDTIGTIRTVSGDTFDELVIWGGGPPALRPVATPLRSCVPEQPPLDYREDSP